MKKQAEEKLFNKYLALLKINKAAPDLNLLKNIVRAHLIRIPFENISKLLYKKQGIKSIPDLPTYLEGIEKYNFGGTCYSNNYYLYLLLKYLGYDIKLCGADMKNPDVHIISIVKINNNEYIVDCGYAAPFFEPLRRDLSENYILNFGIELYKLKPKDIAGRTKVEQYYDGKLQHWYTAKPMARMIGDFREVIEKSYSDDAVFMNAVRITKFLNSGAIVLKNLSLTEVIGNKSSTINFSLTDLASVIQKKFDMPIDLVERAISHFKELRDIYD